MQKIILFFGTFIFILFVYELFIVIPMIRYKSGKSKAKLRKNKQEPMEVRFLVNKYKIDLKKVNYNKLLQVISCVSALDVAILISIITLVDSYAIQLVMSIVLVIPIILISYGLVAKFYKKKGMIKDE